MRTYAASDIRPTWEPKPPTDAQRALISKLMKENGVTPEHLVAVFPFRPETVQAASKVIDWLIAQKPVAKATPTASSQAQDWSDITDGNYALPYNGKTHFYRVSRKEGKGKWAGRTFVNVQERASDELYRVDFKRQTAILHSIREYGVEASHKLFSEVMEQCWHCTKSIGDETNPYKAHGLGPVCGPKVMG